MPLQASCPLPNDNYPRVTMAHGGGGKIMHRLLDQIIKPALAGELLAEGHDGATFDLAGRLAFTTDSFVVHPIFFPGGDIGSLAVHGTVNDLAMCGARPRVLSVALVLEEGLEIAVLEKVMRSLKAAADRCGVQIATGDTKVVERGHGHGIFINTAGIGVVESSAPIGPAQVRAGDAVIVSGDVGRHGMAVMSVREGLAFEEPIESDSAPVHEMVLALLTAGLPLHCLRDPTRGGVATTLCEIASASGWHIELSDKVPVEENVRGACEILGLDPLYVANEGRFLAFVPEPQAAQAVEIIRSFSDGKNAAVIGRVRDQKDGLVTVKSGYGVSRILDMLSGEQLPRIC